MKEWAWRAFALILVGAPLWGLAYHLIMQTQAAGP